MGNYKTKELAQETIKKVPKKDDYEEYFEFLKKDKIINYPERPDRMVVRIAPTKYLPFNVYDAKMLGFQEAWNLDREWIPIAEIVIKYYDPKFPSVEFHELGEDLKDRYPYAKTISYIPDALYQLKQALRIADLIPHCLHDPLFDVKIDGCATIQDFLNRVNKENPQKEKIREIIKGSKYGMNKYKGSKYGLANNYSYHDRIPMKKKN